MALNLNSPTMWYHEEKPEDAARSVLDMGKHLWETQGRQRIQLAEDSLALYLGSRRHSITGASPMGLMALMGVETSSSYNVVQSIANTEIAQCLRNKVRPLFVTEGGDSDLRARVELLQEAVDGLLYGHGMQGPMGVAACTAGHLFEGGGIEWSADCANSRITGTPVWPWEYFVSKREARYGNPRQLFCRQVVDRDVLLSFLANAPKAVRDAVEMAAPAKWEDVSGDMRDPQNLSDQVVIYKSWHLPSGRVDLKDPRAFGRNEDRNKVKPSHDGRHLVAIDQGHPDDPPLVDIPWAYEKFPVSWFKPSYVPGSYWSRGIPEMLASTQIEINKWNARILRILELHARPLIFLWKQAKLNPAQINNALANIFQVDVPPSQAMHQVAAPAIPPDLLNRVAQITQAAKDQLGMNDMTMSAQKPAGINHEPGMAYLGDTETIRKTVRNMAWEAFNIDCAEQQVRCLRELAENDPDFELVFEADSQLRRLKAKDFNVDADKFKVKAWPTNFLKQAPAQRADQIMDFVDRGLFSPEMALEALDAPDIKALMGDRTAIKQNIKNKLSRIVAGSYGPEEMPTPYMDLNMAKLMGMVMYNQLEANEESPDKIQRIVEFLEDVDTLLAKAAAPQAPAGAPMNQVQGAPAPAAA
jgi:hypothetical protein